MLIINPGSGEVPSAGEGWTNTYEGALRQANEWFDRMRVEGLRDIDMIPVLPTNLSPPGDGRWKFEFEHKVTGVRVTLETHGIDDIEAFMAEGRIAYPRVYWAGSSDAEPQVSDWAADGFEVVKTLRPLPEEDDR